MEEKHLHQPLLPLARPAAATTSTIGDVTCPVSDIGCNIISSNYGMALSLRLLLIFLIGVISVWANHEASKGFVITVINDMKHTPVGEKFSLFYVSNDEATRLVQGASNFATKILYASADNNMPEKLIKQVDIQLAYPNSTHDHIVVSEHRGQKNKYVLSISPVIMEYDDFRYRIRKGIQRCMAEVLLFNGKSAAPKTLLDGMVEYISNMAGYGGPKPVLKLRDLNGKCWEDKDPEFVAQFFRYCERSNVGFIGRLNQEMKDGWDEEMVDRALGMPAKNFCKSFHYSMMTNEDLIASESISSYR